MSCYVKNLLKYPPGKYYCSNLHRRKDSWKYGITVGIVSLLTSILSLNLLRSTLSSQIPVGRRMAAVMFLIYLFVFSSILSFRRLPRSIWARLSNKYDDPMESWMNEEDGVQKENPSPPKFVLIDGELLVKEDELIDL
ncbi:MAG: hypothetical protein IH840_06365 [Candidatus Heimdallarchaeota archaeon]|nr:hypothetical protein [Candidatus Heimdallarchaeota archaeon]